MTEFSIARDGSRSTNSPKWGMFETGFSRQNRQQHDVAFVVFLVGYEFQVAALKFFLRAIASLGLGLLTLLLCPLLSSADFPLYAKVYVYPGETIASMVASVVPESWVLGDPLKANYVPLISAVVYIFLCMLVFWSVVIFCGWEVLRWHKRRTQHTPKAYTQ